MTEIQPKPRYSGGGAIIMLIIAVPLWNEFRVRGDLGWNIFLALLLVGLCVAALLLQRYFWRHAAEIGEARFDTTNKPSDS
ncbi:MAG TPA: hypothetical protein VN106_11700 [Sphingomicrobium sp.]|nr:hypothetical protein [Sphingomicrobium sp.]